jgi:hypothetical protein
LLSAGNWTGNDLDANDGYGRNPKMGRPVTIQAEEVVGFERSIKSGKRTAGVRFADNLPRFQTQGNR